MVLNKHFREFFELLEKHGVSFLLVGGYAVGLHGFPRYTGGLDIFVAISQRNAAGLVATFREFGFSDIGLVEADYLDREMIVEIGREPLKIQVLTGIDGMEFDRCFEHRVYFDDAGSKVPFISLKDLIANKAASGRAKEKIHLLELRRIEQSKNSEPGARANADE